MSICKTRVGLLVPRVVLEIQAEPVSCLASSGAFLQPSIGLLNSLGLALHDLDSNSMLSMLEFKKAAVTGIWQSTPVSQRGLISTQHRGLLRQV